MVFFFFKSFKLFFYAARDAITGNRSAQLPLVIGRQNSGVVHINIPNLQWGPPVSTEILLLSMSNQHKFFLLRNMAMVFSISSWVSIIKASSKNVLYSLQSKDQIMSIYI